MLEYSLHDNQLTERPDDFTAVAHSKISYNKEEFIDLMLDRGTLLTRTDVLAVFNGMEETAKAVLRNGEQINLPLFNASFSISGVFEGAMDTFDSNRHKVKINITKGTLVRDVEKEVKLTKVNASSPQPQILEVKDSVSGQTDSTLTPNGVVVLNGINLRISGDSALCGLSFVDEAGVETKATTIVQNKPSTVIAIIPALAKGGYRVKLGTQFSSGGRDKKEPSTTIYSKLLQVS